MGKPQDRQQATKYIGRNHPTSEVPSARSTERQLQSTAIHKLRRCACTKRWEVEKKRRHGGAWLPGPATTTDVPAAAICPIRGDCSGGNTESGGGGNSGSDRRTGPAAALMGAPLAGAHNDTRGGGPTTAAAAAPGGKQASSAQRQREQRRPSWQHDQRRRGRR